MAHHAPAERFLAGDERGCKVAYKHDISALRRTLLVAVGDVAEAVAGRATALSRQWLGVEPPLAVVKLSASALFAPTDATTQQALTEACDGLAEADLAFRLRAAGRPIARGDQIEAWVLIQADVSAPPAASADAGCPGVSLPAALSELVWQRLRGHVTMRALLLADPTAEQQAARWAARLAAAGVEGIGLVGPVNADRLRYDAPDWQAQAAVALALCLWSAARPGNHADHGAPPVGADGSPPWDGSPPNGRPSPDEPAVRPTVVWTAGAAAWPSPGAEIRRQLIPRCAQQGARRLLDATARPGEGSENADDDNLPPWQMPGLMVSPARHSLSLEAAVPPEPAGLTWGSRHPAWDALASVPETLRAEAERRSRLAHDQQFGPRMRWLEEQLARWTTALAELVRLRLMPADGWPDLPGLRNELQGKTAELRAACAEIEEWLEDAGERFARAADDVAQAEAALAALCRSFPEPGLAGAMGLLLAPWRWPRLAWAYLVRLPEAGQRYLDAHARQGAARWSEANLHTLRQAYLVMAQMAQERERQVNAWIEAIEAAGRCLAQEVADLPPPPAPWDARLLDALAEGLAAGPGPDLRWIEADVADAEEVRRSLLAWAEGLTAALADLTAVHWLTFALDDDTLARWLGDRAMEATPLWPVVPPEAGPTTWLLCPDWDDADAQMADQMADRLRRLVAINPAAQQRSAADRLLAAWHRRQAEGAVGDGELRRESCHADVLAVLRMARTDLTDEEGI